MFFLKNHKYLQQQWRRQKNFKTNFLQKIIIYNNNPYLKLSPFKQLFMELIKITLSEYFCIRAECFKYRILKINKKKLSVVLEEVTDKFILSINVKAYNIKL